MPMQNKRSGVLWLPTFHAIIVRGDDLPRIASLQPRVSPNLAHLCVRLGLVFAHSMFAAVDNGKTVSEETHFSLIKSAIVSRACGFLILQLISLREARTVLRIAMPLTYPFQCFQLSDSREFIRN